MWGTISCDYWSEQNKKPVHMALRTFTAGDKVQKLKIKCLAQIGINKSYYMQHKEIWYGNKRDRYYCPVQTPPFY